MKKVFILLFLSFSSVVFAARWNEETKDWSTNPHPVVGDWGFDRPGYPKGLYIHGVTVKEGKRIKNPLIYDNDVYDDVFDDEWMYAMASLKKLKIAALIVTPVLTDFWGFSKPEWVETAHESRDIAIRSGIPERLLPEITVGTEAVTEKDGERKLSDGAHLYVRLINEHYKKNPGRPMLVNIGGQAATLASAFCIDPSIADKCIVYYTDVKVYNGHYEWASKLVAKNFRVISFGDKPWWIAKPSQDRWRVLPHPNEWHLFTSMNVPMLNFMVKQFKSRPEYIKDGSCADGYHDGGFLHAWIPAMFRTAQLMNVRGEGTEAIHITSFGETEEALVKEQTMSILLNPKCYK